MALRNAVLRVLPATALFVGLTAQAGEVIDASGRTVTVAEPVARIAAAGPPAEVLLYALAPDAMVGWVRGVPPQVAPFITAQAKALPTIGGVTAQGDAPDMSGVLATKPQLIVDFGDIDARYTALAIKTQERTGVPYVLLDGELAKTPENLRMLGKLTGRVARSEELAVYAEALLARAKKAAEGHAPVKVYVARSADGTNSTLAGTHSGDVYDLAGLKNVALYEDASVVQVKGWDPDAIIALDPKFADTAKGPLWADVRAVQAGRVLMPPRLPYGWTDRPPSVNRLIGVLWLTSKLYGQPTQSEMRIETAHFYNLFYHVDLSAAQITALIGS